MCMKLGISRSSDHKNSDAEKALKNGWRDVGSNTLVTLKIHVLDQYTKVVLQFEDLGTAEA